MKIKIFAKLTFTFACILGLSLPMNAGCNRQNKGKETENTVVKNDDQSLIKHINAAYMKEHIYDYTQHPNQFVYKGDLPCIIDFYAPWCGPCKKLGPRLEEIAKKYKGKLLVYKVNVDDEADLAEIFGVQSIPMCLFVPTKGIPTKTLGLLSIDQIEQTLSKIL